MAELKKKIGESLDEGNGILHLAPNWVPRAFAVPGARIGLSKEDLYAYGPERGGIDERWIASTTQPDNGPDMVENEGLSEVVSSDGSRFLLKDAVKEDGEAIIGKKLLDTYGRWPTLGKLFDNMGPLPFHLHPRKKHARLVGEDHKPEAYYFPPQYNQIGHAFPHTYFGLEPGTTKDDIRRALDNWNTGDNGVLDLSKAYRINNGTGWMSPAGVLHAPASSVTYEIQWGTDTFAMFQSLLMDGTTIPWDMVVKNVPEDKKQDYDYIIELIDWEANTVSNFKETYFRPPVEDGGDLSRDGYVDKWVIYGQANGDDVFSAKELTVQPGATVTIKDGAPSGMLVVQGHGQIGSWNVTSHNYMRFGELTFDEFFITEPAAKDGVKISNTGEGPLVVLRHLGPDSQPTSLYSA